MPRKSAKAGKNCNVGEPCGVTCIERVDNCRDNMSQTQVTPDVVEATIADTKGKTKPKAKQATISSQNSTSKSSSIESPEKIINSIFSQEVDPYKNLIDEGLLKQKTPKDAEEYLGEVMGKLDLFYASKKPSEMSEAEINEIGKGPVNDLAAYSYVKEATQAKNKLAKAIPRLIESGDLTTVEEVEALVRITLEAIKPRSLGKALGGISREEAEAIKSQNIPERLGQLSIDETGEGSRGKFKSSEEFLNERLAEMGSPFFGPGKPSDAVANAFISAAGISNKLSGAGAVSPPNPKTADAAKPETLALARIEDNDPNPLTPVNHIDLAKRYLQQNGRDFYTNLPLSLADAELEHLQPYAGGGPHAMENVSWISGSINKYRGNSTGDEVLQRMSEIESQADDYNAKLVKSLENRALAVDIAARSLQGFNNREEAEEWIRSSTARLDPFDETMIADLRRTSFGKRIDANPMEWKQTVLFGALENFDKMRAALPPGDQEIFDSIFNEGTKKPPNKLSKEAIKALDEAAIPPKGFGEKSWGDYIDRISPTLKAAGISDDGIASLKRPEVGRSLQELERSRSQRQDTSNIERNFADDPEAGRKFLFQKIFGAFNPTFRNSPQAQGVASLVYQTVIQRSEEATMWPMMNYIIQNRPALLERVAAEPVIRKGREEEPNTIQRLAYLDAKAKIPEARRRLIQEVNRLQDQLVDFLVPTS